MFSNRLFQTIDCPSSRWLTNIWAKKPLRKLQKSSRVWGGVSWLFFFHDFSWFFPFSFRPRRASAWRVEKPKFRGKEICTDESHRELRFTAIPCKCHVAMLCVCVHNTFYQETTTTTITAVITFGGFQSSAPCEPAEKREKRLLHSSPENYLSSPKNNRDIDRDTHTYAHGEPFSRERRGEERSSTGGGVAAVSVEKILTVVYCLTSWKL